MGCSSLMGCLTRVPFGTLIATILCVSGMAVFCGTMFKGIVIILKMLDISLNYTLNWITHVQTFFVIIGACMGGFALILLFIGILSTGATRKRVYTGWSSRVGGRVSIGIFMVITYILHVVWILIMACLVVLTFVTAIFSGYCNTLQASPERYHCLNLSEFSFLFPNNTIPPYQGLPQQQYYQKNNIVICDYRLIRFCEMIKDSEVMFGIAFAAAALVIISLVHFLICLAANYAHVKSGKKLDELEQLNYLQNIDLGTLPKEKF